MAQKRLASEIWLENAISTDITRERITKAWIEGKNIIATDGHRAHVLYGCAVHVNKKYIGHEEHPTTVSEIFNGAMEGAKNVWTGSSDELRGIFLNLIDTTFVSEIAKLQQNLNGEVELLKIAPLNVKHKESVDETIHCMHTLVKEKNNKNILINIEQVTGFYIRFRARYLIEALHGISNKTSAIRINLHIIPTTKFENPLIIEIQDFGKAIIMPMRG